MSFGDEPRKALREVLTNHGLSILENPVRLESILKERFKDWKVECRVLLEAFQEGIVAELKSASVLSPELKKNLFYRLASTLKKNLALTDDAATWAVESWAYALTLDVPKINTDVRADSLTASIPEYQKEVPAVENPILPPSAIQKLMGNKVIIAGLLVLIVFFITYIFVLKSSQNDTSFDEVEFKKESNYQFMEISFHSGANKQIMDTLAANSCFDTFTSDCLVSLKTALESMREDHQSASKNFSSYVEKYDNAPPKFLGFRSCLVQLKIVNEALNDYFVRYLDATINGQAIGGTDLGEEEHEKGRECIAIGKSLWGEAWYEELVRQ